MAQNNIQIVEKRPIIKLKNKENFFDDCIGAALTCYKGRPVDPKTKSQKYLKAVGDGCYQGRHHTVFQHAQFKFELDFISRQVTWEILHSHPFYNTSQASQRYVKLDEIGAVIPEFKEKSSRELFVKGITEAWDMYRKLSDILTPEVKKHYCRRFKKDPTKLDDNDMDSISKRAIEVARYTIPIAAYTSMIYSINGVTLHRLHRLKHMGNSGWEAAVIIDRMVEEVNQADPRFFERIEDPMPIEDTLEYKVMQDLSLKKGNPAALSEFDKELGGMSSKLIDYSSNAERIVADSARLVLGLTKEDIGDMEMLDYLLNPVKNSYLSEILNMSTHSPVMRALNNTHYVFKKKLSHTGDSQNQRHRTTPAARPFLMAHDTIKPDYITPGLIEANQEAKEKYGNWMKRAWEIKNTLIDKGEEPSKAIYILPNAKFIRLIEDNPLIYLMHKLNNRSCNNAQEEIWRISMEEIAQVKEVHPNIGKYLGQPTCVNRYQKNEKPYCLEGKRWCGMDTWNVWPDVKRDI